MKKVASVLLVVCLLAAMIPTAFAQPRDKEVILTAYVENLSADSASLKTQTLDGNRYAARSQNVRLSYRDGVLNAQGKIKGLNKKFDIQASAKNTASAGLVAFEGSDRHKNFEVIHMAYSQRIADTALYHDGMKRVSPEASVLKLYLKAPGENALAVVEIFNPAALDRSDLMREKRALPMDENAAFWYSKVFAAEAEELPSLARTKDNNDGTYRYTFEHLGGKVYHNMTLRREVTVPQNLYGQADFGTVLEVVKEWSTSTDFPDQNTNNSCFSVSDVKIEIGTGAYDYIESYQITGTVHTSWSVDVSLDFDTSIPIYGPVSLGLNYTKSDPSAKISNDFFDLSGMPRAALSSLESNKRLESEGHKYSTWWRISKQDSTTRTNDFKVRFYYDLSNIYDYTWGGPRTLTKTYSYTSNN